MKTKIPTLDWNDTFLDVKHLRASFPDYKIRATEDDRSKHVPPFRYLYLLKLLYTFLKPRTSFQAYIKSSEICSYQRLIQSGLLCRASAVGQGYPVTVSGLYAMLKVLTFLLYN
jgi:hypothetical protein